MAPLITVKSGGPDIEPGTYPASLISIEAETINSGVSQYNPSGEPQDVFVWTFDLGEDEETGESIEVSGVTSQMTGPKSKTMQFLRALGLDPQPKDEIDPADLVGRQALATIERNDKGWPKVTGLTALPKQPRKSAAKPAPRPTVREQVAETEDEDDLPF
jgi:hypothetical protein